MRRSLFSAALAVLALMILAMPAAASKGWCRSDPVVLIDDNITDIYIDAPLNAPLLVTGPTELTITVPTGVDTQLIFADLGFGYGYELTFVESRSLRKTVTGVEVQIAVYVPAHDSTMPVKLNLASGLGGLLSPLSAEGTANSWVILKTKL